MQDNRVLKKASETMNAAFFSNIKKGKDFAGIKSENSAVIYSGKSLPATNAGALRGQQPPLEGVASNAVRARGRLPPPCYSSVSTVKF